MNALNTEQTRDMLMSAAHRIIENEALLTEADSAVGDGDHGIGMSGGMKKALAALEDKQETDTPYALFERMGRAMLMSMGGASGVIFGSLFLAGAKGAAAASLDAQSLAELFERSLQAIEARGGAKPGDKTMVDALDPAVRAMKENAPNGLPAMLEKAAEAAKSGMEATAGYIARFGRAKSLMERALGHVDAGAVSVWLIFDAMAAFARRTQGETHND